MKFYEINALFKYSFYRKQEEWEQTRMIGFINAQCSGAKNLTLQKLITFPWESEDNNSIKKTSITKTDIEQYENLKKKAEMLLQNNLI